MISLIARGLYAFLGVLSDVGLSVMEMVRFLLRAWY